MCLSFFKQHTGTLFMSFDLTLSLCKSGHYHYLPYLVLQGCLLGLSLIGVGVGSTLAGIVTFTTPPLTLNLPPSTGTSTPNAPNAPAVSVLKVQSYNIRCGIDRRSTYDLSRCVATITAVSADVCLLQEVTEMGMWEGWVGTTSVKGLFPEAVKQVDVMVEMLRKDAAWTQAQGVYLGPYDLTEVGRAGTYGIGIVSKRPWKRCETLTYTRVGNRQKRGAIAVLTESDVWAVCTHLQHDVTGYEQVLQVSAFWRALEQLFIP